MHRSSAIIIPLEQIQPSCRLVCTGRFNALMLHEHPDARCLYPGPDGVCNCLLWRPPPACSLHRCGCDDRRYMAAQTARRAFHSSLACLVVFRTVPVAAASTQVLLKAGSQRMLRVAAFLCVASGHYCPCSSPCPSPLLARGLTTGPCLSLLLVGEPTIPVHQMWCNKNTAVSFLISFSLLPHIIIITLRLPHRK